MLGGLVNALTGERQLRRVRDRAQDFARKMYDPRILDPQADVARQQATMGIDEGIYRQRGVTQAFRTQPQTDVYGGNQAAAIAGSAIGDIGRQRSLTDFEFGLAQADLGAREQGRATLGTVQSQQRQLQAQQGAAIDEAQMMYESERGARQQQLLGLGIGLAGSFLMSGGAAKLKGGALSLVNTLKGNTSAIPSMDEGIPDLAMSPDDLLGRLRGTEPSGTEPTMGQVSGRNMTRAFMGEQVERTASVAPAPAPATTAPTPTVAPAAPRLASQGFDLQPIAPNLDGSMSSPLDGPPLSQLTQEDITAFDDYIQANMPEITQEEYEQLRQEFMRSKMPNLSAGILGGTSDSDPMDFFRAYGQAAKNFWGAPIRWIDEAATRRAQAEQQQFEQFLQNRRR